MKNSRLILALVAAFILGYAAHMLVGVVLLEQRRAAMETFYQKEFPIGEDFEKVAGPWRERGLQLKSYPEKGRFDASLPSDFSTKLELFVQVDEKQRIKSVIVIHPILK